MKTLIVVDCQYDFVNPKGTLFVPGADKVCENIRDFILKREIDEAIFTVDFHKPSNYSFKINGGIWPVHCVQYTHGASINDSLLEACNECNIPWQVLRKGEIPNIEEYGAFEQVKMVSGNLIRLSSQGHSIYTEGTEFIVCGVAGDYCVKQSLMGLEKLPKHCKLSVFMDGVASIDDGSILKEYIKQENINVI